MDIAFDVRAKVGESPVWSAEQGLLYWVDIEGYALHASNPATGSTRTWMLEGRPGALALTSEESRLLVAVENEMVWLDLDCGEVDPWVTVYEPMPKVRLNDGRTDPSGRFWIGGMFDPPQARQFVSHLYRVDPDGSVTTTRDEVACANGSAFSPDGTVMYWADSVRGTVWAYDYDVETGTPSNERVFLDFSDLPGAPDGACVDEDGCYWSACVEGSAVLRATPAGEVDRIIELPVKLPTMPAFGGPDLDTIFITSIKTDEGGPDGAVLAFNPGVRGIPEPKFAGPTG